MQAATAASTMSPTGRLKVSLMALKRSTSQYNSPRWEAGRRWLRSAASRRVMVSAWLTSPVRCRRGPVVVVLLAF